MRYSIEPTTQRRYGAQQHSFALRDKTGKTLFTANRDLIEKLAVLFQEAYDAGRRSVEAKSGS